MSCCETTASGPITGRKTTSYSSPRVPWQPGVPGKEVGGHKYVRLFATLLWVLFFSFGCISSLLISVLSLVGGKDLKAQGEYRVGKLSLHGKSLFCLVQRV